ncbi:DNA recombination protein RecO [Bacillus sp. 3103sda1]|uniref:DNA recombination protein RecO n=1 Tax=unclassified Bacillus (in: firmicutes) TaxID=185979 RepID=UPI00209E6637|nr:DNA recombination protein RecO [Bacillus sp. 3103sda1]MCP1125103.1 DNA recombination protein RecO [Bacillus sp. 3103sda1]
MNIWLILFLPTVIIWGVALAIQMKCGQSNHLHQEPMIFYSQQIFPIKVKETELRLLD